MPANSTLYCSPYLLLLHPTRPPHNPAQPSARRACNWVDIIAQTQVGGGEFEVLLWCLWRAGNSTMTSDGIRIRDQLRLGRSLQVVAILSDAV